ncbi:hypothetical protein Q9295_02475 [Xinfangfangia sp. CPCC 101601]|uniref:Alpha-glutamyl/putrescinyl thymine pyrophosphorylase clade 3 domain-containing protein n=1 Tax=Pseudogemmobacter lacusdianii TaxID=3069608 RepID=A0ABU0VU16_9RHOB|nr:hypothetical protein [Xinfangfangia sp. CPCC 101601]MDQ2065226.1 hypothetical protein [Xinfangfangia sp. CPCC 101601]
MRGAFRNNQGQLEANLNSFRFDGRSLQGIQSNLERTVLTLQIIDSLRRTHYVRTLSNKATLPERADPNSPIFDPIRAAVFLRNTGHFDEALWVTFIGTHCGKHKIYGWRLAAAIYSGLRNNGAYWTWQRISQNPAGFIAWMQANQATLLSARENLKFSNHRKYESLNTGRQNHTGEVFASYVNWVSAHNDHRGLINHILTQVGQNPERVFDELYNQMSSRVTRFGRLGAFDHICMLGKLNLAPASPGSTYIKDATGPRRGANLLISNNANFPNPVNQIEATLSALSAHLGIGMQEIEDSLCNWQKSPQEYVHFKG